VRPASKLLSDQVNHSENRKEVQLKTKRKGKKQMNTNAMLEKENNLGEKRSKTSVNEEVEMKK